MNELRMDLDRRGTLAVAVAVAFVAGGVLATLIIGAVLALLGPPALCARNLLCAKAGYTNLGAASGVHLVGTDDPFSSLAVVWSSPGRQQPPRVQYRQAGDETWSVAAGASEPAPRNGLLPGDGFLHHVRVAGLVPGTRYEYRVSRDPRSKDKDYSQVFTTRTPSAAGPVRLAFVSDICLKNRPDGRSGPIDALMRQLLSADVDLILGGGDYACAVDDGRYPAAEPAIQRFFDEWQPVFARIPFYAEYGNHECCVGEQSVWWDARLDHSGFTDRTADGRSFAFDLLDTHLVGLYATGASKAVPAEHLAWLEETLSAARHRGQRHLLVFEHAPVYSTGRRHPSEPELRHQLAPILEHYQVDLHLSAHDMSYERTFPLLEGGEGGPEVVSREGSAYPAWAGVVYAKISPSGRASGNQDNVPDPIAPYLAAVDDQHFIYGILTLSSEGPLRMTVYALDPTGHAQLADEIVLYSPSDLRSR
jgi:predicted MPP superfamily phosphohydrolase